MDVSIDDTTPGVEAMSDWVTPFPNGFTDVTIYRTSTLSGTKYSSVPSVSVDLYLSIYRMSVLLAPGGTDNPVHRHMYSAASAICWPATSLLPFQNFKHGQSASESFKKGVISADSAPEWLERLF